MNSNNLIERLNEHASYLRAFKDEGQTMIERQCIAAMSEASILIQSQAAEIARLTGLAPPIERYPMTDQPTQDAIVTQRDFEMAGMLEENEWPGNHAAWTLIIAQHFATYRAEIEAATIERCAGVAIDEKVDALATQEETDAAYNAGIDDAVEAIRNLKGQTS